MLDFQRCDSVFQRHVSTTTDDRRPPRVILGELATVSSKTAGRKQAWFSSLKPPKDADGRMDTFLLILQEPKGRIFAHELAWGMRPRRGGSAGGSRRSGKAVPPRISSERSSARRRSKRGATRQAPPAKPNVIVKRTRALALHRRQRGIDVGDRRPPTRCRTTSGPSDPPEMPAAFAARSFI